ncbi:MAG: recombinase family protein [Lachnospiraceae bacterium]
MGKDYTTKFGKEHTSLSIKDILSNLIYCTADEISYDYFYQRDGKICVDMEVFDGIHGIMAYNKTDQEKLEDEESTFIEPKFVQVCTDKPISEWIIAVGKHEGFIPSAEWIETQELLEAIADKYNRPHRATNALLGGLVYCPICGGRLNVFPESNRWTNGKPRFKYGCPKRRGKENAVLSLLTETVLTTL